MTLKDSSLIGSARNQLSSLAVPTFLGMLIAFIFFWFSGKEIRWSMGFLFLSAWSFALCVTNHKKIFLILSLFFAFTIQTTVNLWLPRPPVYPTGAASTSTAIELFVFDPPLLCLLLFLAFSFDKNTDRNLWNSDIAALLFALACCFSMVHSAHRDLSLVRIPVMLRMPLIYYCMSRGITSQKEVNGIVQMLILCVFIQGTLAILQALSGSLGWLNYVVERTEQVTTVQAGKLDLGRATGTIGYATVFAQYMGMLSPLTLVFFLFGTRTWQRIFAGSAFLLSVISLIISLSRIEWVCLPLFFLMIVSIMGWLRKITARHFFKILLVLLVGCLILTLFSERIILRLTEPDSDSAYSRIPMAKTALRMIAANPVFGVGLHNYTYAKHSYGGDNDMSGDFGVHNSFLYVAAEIGCFGLVLLLYLWFLTYKRVLYCVMKGNLAIALVALGLFGGLAVLFLHSMFEQGFHIHQQISAMLWAFFGLAAAMKTMVYFKQSGE